MSTLGSGTISFWHSRNDYAINHFHGAGQKICLVKRKVLSDEEIVHGCPLSKILLISRLVLRLIKFQVLLTYFCALQRIFCVRNYLIRSTVDGILLKSAEVYA